MTEFSETVFLIWQCYYSLTVSITLIVVELLRANFTRIEPKFKYKLNMLNVCNDCYTISCATDLFQHRLQ